MSFQADYQRKPHFSLFAYQIVVGDKLYPLLHTRRVKNVSPANGMLYYH